MTSEADWMKLADQHIKLGLYGRAIACLKEAYELQASALRSAQAEIEELKNELAEMEL